MKGIIEQVERIFGSVSEREQAIINYVLEESGVSQSVEEEVTWFTLTIYWFQVRHLQPQCDELLITLKVKATIAEQLSPSFFKKSYQITLTGSKHGIDQAEKKLLSFFKAQS